MKKKILGSGFQRHKQCVPPSVLQTCTLLHSHWHLDVCHPMGSTCIWPSTILVSIMILEADFAPRSLCPLCSFRRSKSKEQDGLWGGCSSTERLAHGIWLRTLSPAVQGVTSQKQVLPAQRLHRPNQALPALPDWWHEGNNPGFAELFLMYITQPRQNIQTSLALWLNIFCLCLSQSKKLQNSRGSCVRHDNNKLKMLLKP